MKILSIYINNLNSLKGELKINFEQEPFTTHNLFAIVGPTGAGKTTILDAITLALYGRVFRYGNGANESPKDRVITHGQKEAKAEVEFIGKDGIRYSSAWSMRYTRTGNTTTPQRQIANCSLNPPKVIATKEKEIEEKLEKVIGLKYNQFIRSIILPQGNFTAFLKASENEKAAILEYITGTEKFSEISKLTFQMHKEQKQKTELLKQKLSDFTPLTEEEKNTLLQNLHSLNHDNQQYTTQKNQLEQQRNLHLEIQKLSNEIEKIRNEKLQLEDEYSSYQQDFQKYEFYLKHENLFQLYEKHQELINNSHLKNQEYQKLNQQLLEHAPKFNQIEHQITQLDQEITQLIQEIEHKKPIWEQATNLQNNIQQLITQNKEISRNLNQFKEKLNILRKDIENQQNKQNQLLNQQNNTLQWISAHKSYEALLKNQSLIHNYYEKLQKYTQDKTSLEKQNTQLHQTLQNIQHQINDSLTKQQNLEAEKEQLLKQEEALNNTIQQLQEQLPDNPPERQAILNLERLYQIAKQYLNTQDRLQKSQQTHEKNQQILEQTLKDLSTARIKLSELNEIIDKKKKQIELQNDIEELEHYRVKLKTGEPCPLCGATEHPFSHKISTTLYQLQDELQYFQEQSEEINAEIKTLTAKKEEYSAKIDAYKNQEKDFLSQLDEYQQEFSQLNTTTFDITQLEPIHLLKEQLEKEYNHYDNLLKTIKTHEEDLKKISKSIKNNTEAIQKIIETYTVLNSNQKENEINLKNTQQRLKELEQEINTIHNNLKQIYPEYTTKTTFDQLKNLISEYENRQKELEDLSRNIEIYINSIENYKKQEIEVQKNIQEQEKRQNEVNQRIQHIRDELNILIPSGNSAQEEEEIYQNKVQKKQEEKEKLIHQKNTIANEITRLNALKEKVQEEIKTLSEQVQNLTLDIQKYQNEHKISQENFDILYLDASQRENIKSHYTTYTNQIQEKSTILSNKNHQKQELQQQINTSLSLESLLEKIKNIEQKIRENDQEIGKYKERLEQDEKNRREQNELYLQLQLQEQTLRRWSELNELIGSEKGDKFRRFVQGLTLTKLTLLANTHLKELNPRYSLRKKPGEELELEVIDAYQADEVRDIASLSGGETFLVSLALALGLSDLVGRDAQVRSLFIDEGFGTLDPDTLDVAITALENLQISGKTIGIISHVEALKERIHAKIILEKTNEGTSKVRIFPSRSM